MAASAIEHIQSRTGNTTGLLGAQNFSRTFHVTLSAAGDDPIETLASLSPNANGVQVGSPHPDDASQVALRFVRGQLFSRTRIEIRVEYGLPLVINDIPGENDGWRFSLDHSLETETVVLDINGNQVGAGAYIRVPYRTDEDEFKSGSTSEKNPLFGKFLFPLTIDPLDAAYIKNRDDKVDQKTIYQTKAQLRENDGLMNMDLYKVIDGQRTQPVSRTVKVATLTITRTFPTMTQTELSRLVGANNTVNANTFFGAEQNTLKVVDVHVSDRTGTLAGQTTPGILNDVAVSFQWRPDGHNRQQQFHTFIDNFGNESVIHLKGKPQFNIIDMYDVASFTFSSGGVFQATTPLQRIGGIRIGP